MTINNRKALEAAELLAEHCKKQRGCQNCIFRIFAPGQWKCQIDCIEHFNSREVLSNIKAKEKNHGYL